MSRSSCRRYKRYRETYPKEPDGDKIERTRKNEHQHYFGEITARREDGVIDLTPYAAAKGEEIVSTVRYDSGRSIVKRRGRPPKQRAL